MSGSLLVRHPPPYPTESLMGYVLRLSEQNGYSTPWSLCQFAGLKQNEFRTTGMPVDKLAAVANRRPSELEPIAYTPPPGRPRWACLLGHPIVPIEMSVMPRRFCPECVAERGFVEAHWHLRLMAACPIHLRVGASICPNCGQPLRWFRPGLLECDCGGSLLDRLPPSISETDASLFAAIRIKVLGFAADGENPAHLPLNHLMALNLRSMLAVIRALGRFRLNANGNTATIDELQTVLAATEVLRQWPTNFIKLMSDLGQDAQKNLSGGVSKQFEGIYRALFKNKAVEPREQTDFLKSAFLDFAVNHWGRGFVDHKLMKWASEPTRRRYITQSEFAATLGVQPRTAARLLKERTVTSDRVKCGKAERVIVDASHNVIHKTQPGRILRAREAARQLVLPVPVLSPLRETGEFEVTHLSPVQPGWHEKDVEAFGRKLLALARHDSEAGESITMAAIMRNRHHSPEIKADLVRAMLSKEVPVFGTADGNIGGMQLDFYLYRNWLGDAMRRAAGNARTPAEAAKALHCDRGAIPGLIQLGLLNGTKTPKGLRIDDESVTQFSKKYVSLAFHAKCFGTSTRALMRSCERAGVQMLLVPMMRRAGPQPFVRVADVETILPSAA